MDSEQLLNIINPRRHLNEPKSINQALQMYKKLNIKNEDIKSDNLITEPTGSNKKNNLVKDELKNVIMENDKEESFFKVIGQEEVGPTCKSKSNNF